jgi:VanZ family protein
MPESPPARPDGDAPAERARRSALDVARLAALPPQMLMVGMALLASLVLFAELPGRPLILHVLQKLAHPLVFGAIAAGVLAIEYQRAPVRALPVQYLRALALATLAGALTEVAQLFTHRDPALRDVWLDARGAACALAFAMTFDSRWRALMSRRWRTVGLLAGITLAAMMLAPLAWTAAGYARRGAGYPVLFTPGSSLDLLFVGLTAGPPELARAPATIARKPQESALRVPLQSRPYAGVTLDEPSPDWSGYDTLALDVGNAGRNDLALHVRVHDRAHDWTAGDRFNGEARIPAGERVTVEFPLATIRTAPQGRMLDLANVAGVALYRAGPEGPREFWLFRVELQKKDGRAAAGAGHADVAPGTQRENVPPCAGPTPCTEVAADAARGTAAPDRGAAQ